MHRGGDAVPAIAGPRLLLALWQGHIRRAGARSAPETMAVRCVCFIGALPLGKQLLEGHDDYYGRVVAVVAPAASTAVATSRDNRRDAAV